MAYEKQRAYYARKRTDPDFMARRAEYQQRQREQDPERYLAETREWRDKNRERLREYDRQRRAADPTRTAAAYAIGHANQDAKRLGIAGRLRTTDVLALWERQPVCATCGEGRGIDHIVEMTAGGENTPANIQTMCFACNSKKETARRHARTAGTDSEPGIHALPGWPEGL